MKNHDILERTVAYSLRMINVYRALENDSVGRIIGKQILRSGTSVGANVHEAQGAQSQADFIAKMAVAHKEAYESLYWLRLIQEAKLIPATKLGNLYDETEQLVKIITAILVNTRRNGEP